MISTNECILPASSLKGIGYGSGRFVFRSTKKIKTIDLHDMQAQLFSRHLYNRSLPNS